MDSGFTPIGEGLYRDDKTGKIGVLIPASNGGWYVEDVSNFERKIKREYTPSYKADNEINREIKHLEAQISNTNKETQRLKDLWRKEIRQNGELSQKAREYENLVEHNEQYVNYRKADIANLENQRHSSSMRNDFGIGLKKNQVERLKQVGNVDKNIKDYENAFVAEKRTKMELNNDGGLQLSNNKKLIDKDLSNELKLKEQENKIQDLYGNKTVNDLRKYSAETIDKSISGQNLSRKMQAEFIDKANNENMTYGEFLEKKFGSPVDRNDLSEDDDDNYYKEYKSVVDRYEKDKDFRDMLKKEHDKTMESARKEIKAYIDLPQKEKDEIGTEDDLHRYINENYYSIDKKDFDKIYQEELGKVSKTPYQHLKEHILSHYTEDYGYDAESPEQALIDEVNYMKYGNLTNTQIGEEIAGGGSYLVYNQDMADFLNEAGIGFAEGEEFDTYKKVIGRATDQIINEYQAQQSELQSQRAKKLASEIRQTQQAYSNEKISQMSAVQLRQLAKDYGIETKGQSKQQLLSTLLYFFNK